MASQELSMAAVHSAWAARPDLRAVYKEHSKYIHGLLARLLGPSGDPEDMMQEVFIVALRKLDKVRGEDLRPWLCNIAVRLAAAARRRVWFSRVLGLAFAPEELDWRTPDRLYEMDEASRRMYAALDRLSEKKRTVFMLYELQGMSGPEIAATLRCPEKTVWSRLLHARREFLRAIEEQEASAKRGTR